METAIVTIGRWESIEPPRGETLLKLANAASKHEQIVIANRFRELFLAEVMNKYLHAGQNDTGVIKSDIELRFARAVQFVFAHLYEDASYEGGDPAHNLAAPLARDLTSTVEGFLGQDPGW